MKRIKMKRIKMKKTKMKEKSNILNDIMTGSPHLKKRVQSP